MQTNGYAAGMPRRPPSPAAYPPAAAFAPPFLDPGPLADDELALHVEELHAANPAYGIVPSYGFAIRRRRGDVRVGQISLRLSDAERFLLYYGQIGYGVDASFRGHGYASRAVRLLVPFARRHAFPELWITCGPENTASRRTCENAGFRFVEIVPVPLAYQGAGITAERCRYHLALG